MKHIALIILLLTSFVFTQAAFSQGRSAFFLTERIDNASEHYLGHKYIADPLGEGYGYDADPLYRFDAFDCTTYVETVMALALADNMPEFELLMNRIRYKNAQISFTERNHFISADWIPNNKEVGLISDLTEFVAAGEKEKSCSKILSTKIDKQNWFLQKHGQEVDVTPVVAKLPYVTSEDLLESRRIQKRIPSGAIVNFVRDNSHMVNIIGTDLDIVHQGIVIRKPDGKLYLRHARNKNYGVLEENFLEFLKSQPQYFGVNILTVLPR